VKSSALPGILVRHALAARQPRGGDHLERAVDRRRGIHLDQVAHVCPSGHPGLGRQTGNREVLAGIGPGGVADQDPDAQGTRLYFSAQEADPLVELSSCRGLLPSLVSQQR
jgi:hypothetical protein